jgi:DNA-directed RNA polymerase
MTPAQVTGIGFHLLYAVRHTVPGLLAFHAPQSPTGPFDSVASRLSLTTESIAQYGLDTLRRLSVRRPMLAPPRQWSASQRGGYAYALADSVPLVRNVSALDADPKCSPIVYDTLNALQETAWRINESVLGVAQQIPDTLTDEQALIVGEAVDEAASEALYFVHSLDFCGRVYPVGTYLTPQGPDLARGLLRFANGCTITAHDTVSIAALDHYGGQCLGAPPDLATVVRIARDPVGTQPIWGAAKKPWQYLAFCCERSGLADAHADGQRYVSTLPVWQDALANGLQHMALLLRDSELAPLVNLLPNASKDIYEDVAERMTVHLRTLAYGVPIDDPRSLPGVIRDPDADALLDHYGGEITRDLAKSPTMLFGYGVTLNGIRERFIEDTGLNPAQARSFAQAAWVTLNTGATARAFELRDWFHNVGRAIGRTGRSAEWTVPGTMFPAAQRHYFEAREDARLSFQWEDIARPMRLRVFNGLSNKLDEFHHATSLAPNIIHSLDAAHLMLTVTQMPSGVSIGTVHDGFATCAKDAAQLEQAFKSAFVTLYGDGRDPLQDLARQFGSQCEKLPEPPTQGTLVVSPAMFGAAKPLR